MRLPGWGAAIACVAGLLVLASWVPRSHATILVFDQMRELGVVVPTVSGNDVPQDYGDRVAASSQAVPGGLFTYGEAGEGFTPNLVVDYFSGVPVGIGVSLWQDSYGDLTNVVFGNQNSSVLSVRLTADAGFSALLYGFDLGGWNRADFTIGAVRVLGGSGALFSQSDVLVEGNLSGPGHTAFAFASPLSAGELLIEIDYSNLPGSQQDNIGIDNIRFGQSPPAPIPEPANWLMLVFGLCALSLLLNKNCRSGCAACGRRPHGPAPAASRTSGTPSPAGTSPGSR